MKIGLFFGSFNPVHIGHMIIADFMATQTDLQQVWMVVSPHNPLKSRASLANDYDRLFLVDEAIGDNPHIKSSQIEFSLPKPSYTVDTLTYLGEKYPHHEFVLIMGGDNLATIYKWKNYQILLRDYDIYLYRRPRYDASQQENLERVKTFEAPLMELSSTMIRARIKEGQSIRYLVPELVRKGVEEKGLYQN